MDIIITIEIDGQQVEVKTDENQMIEVVIKELVHSGYIPGLKGNFLRSVQEEKLVSVKNTFKQENIYSGDKLVPLQKVNDERE